VVDLVVEGMVLRGRGMDEPIRGRVEGGRDGEMVDAVGVVEGIERGSVMTGADRGSEGRGLDLGRLSQPLLLVLPLLVPLRLFPLLLRDTLQAQSGIGPTP
jgi:hypothetical protein